VTEHARLAAVRRYDVLDTPPDGAFDRITAIAARLLKMPVAIVSVVDTDRIWFKSHHGVEAEQIGRDPGLCASCILQDGPWMVNDARSDPRTLANPLVAGEFGAQFYLGVPLRTHDGFNLGTLCVLDFVPRTVTQVEVAHLVDLAAVVMDELELRLSAKEALAAYRDELARRELREDHISGLSRELAHRSKNLLAVVHAIARQTTSSSSSIKDYVQRLAARILGLADTHDLISEREWHGVTLGDLVARHLDPFLDSPARVEVTGPTIILTPIAAQNIGLALHELATNAVKFGALAVPEGRVVFGWERHSGNPDLLRISWREENCPVSERSHEGFGRLVLERIAPEALEGKATLSFEPECLSWVLEVPTTHALSAESAGTPSPVRRV
jgi:two-component sensor histidine kinase